MKLYRTTNGPLVERDGSYFLLPDMDWSGIFMLDDPAAALADRIVDAASIPAEEALLPSALLAPVDRQEVWAAGVTYFRSRDARMEEAKQAGGEDFYARVYDAERPELFMKATAHRVVGPGQ